MAAPNASRRSPLRLAAALAASAALSACMTIGPNFHRPPSPTESGYSMAGETGPALQHVALASPAPDQWWTVFGSADLDAVMTQALAGSPTLAAANATLAQAQAELRAARGAEYPQIDASAGAERERLNLASFGFRPGLIPGFPNNPTFNLYSVGGTASYALDLWGGTRRAVESAAAQAESRAHEADAAYLTLTGNVATQAATIAALRAELATVDAIIADDQQNLRLVRSAQAAGGEAEQAGVSATAQLAADQALLPPLQQQLAAARHALALLVGRAPADWSPPNFDLDRLTLPAEIPLNLPSELVHERPDILQAEADLHAATAQIGVATARMYPNITLSASLTQAALTPGALFKATSTAYTLGAGLTAPIFHGGQLKAQREAAVQAANAARARYEQTVLEAFTQVADLLQALAHNEAELAAQQRALAQAQASLQLARTAYEEGGTGLLPVVDAEREYNNARLAVTRTQASRYLHTIQLFVATGHGWRPGRTMASAAR